jgi:hypothetical protein
MEIKDIDFILSHFDSYTLFPRKMMTSVSNGQFSITSKDEIFEKCKQANFIDCSALSPNSIYLARIKLIYHS